MKAIIPPPDEQTLAAHAVGEGVVANGPPMRRYRPGERVEIGSMDGLDLILLLALLPLHWTLFLLVVAQWFVRRNPALLDGLLRPAGVDIYRVAQSPRAREWLPGLNYVLDDEPVPPTVMDVRPVVSTATDTLPQGDNPALLTTLLTQPLSKPPVEVSVPHAPIPAPAAPPPLAFSVWRKVVQNAPNVIVVGAPGTGKSTLIRAFLPTFAQQGQIIVLDPHGVANDWGELDPVGVGRDYGAVGNALIALTDELSARYRTRPPYVPLRIVIDEVPSITLNVKSVWENTYPPLVFEGRKVGIRTIVMTQSAQVKPLGLDGKGDLRSSLVWIYLGRFATEKCAAAAAQPYPAAMEWEGEVVPIDTAPLAVYAKLPVPATAQWGAEQLAEPTELEHQTMNADRDATIIQMMREHQSINAICAVIGGSKVRARDYIQMLARATDDIDERYK